MHNYIRPVGYIYVYVYTDICKSYLTLCMLFVHRTIGVNSRAPVSVKQPIAYDVNSVLVHFPLSLISYTWAYQVHIIIISVKLHYTYAHTWSHTHKYKEKWGELGTNGAPYLTFCGSHFSGNVDLLEKAIAEGEVKKVTKESGRIWCYSQSERHNPHQSLGPVHKGTHIHVPCSQKLTY